MTLESFAGGKTMILSRIRALRTGIGILALVVFVFTVASCAREPSKPSTGSSKSEATQTTQPAGAERAQFEFVRFTPDPVEPDTSCVVTVIGNAERVTLAVPGASTSRGPLPGSEFWKKNNERVELSAGAAGTWDARFLAPSEAGVYPVSLIVTRNGSEQAITKPEWVLRVYPADFLNRPSFPTPERAIEAAIADSYPGAKIDTIERRPLLEEDRRNEAFNRLYLVTFTLPHGTPVRRPGRNSEFFYVLKDGPSGDWRVLMSGSGP